MSDCKRAPTGRALQQAVTSSRGKTPVFYPLIPHRVAIFARLWYVFMGKRFPQEDISCPKLKRKREYFSVAAA